MSNTSTSTDSKRSLAANLFRTFIILGVPTAFFYLLSTDHLNWFEDKFIDPETQYITIRSGFSVWWHGFFLLLFGTIVYLLDSVGESSRTARRFAFTFFISGGIFLYMGINYFIELRPDEVRSSHFFSFEQDHTKISDIRKIESDIAYYSNDEPVYYADLILKNNNTVWLPNILIFDQEYLPVLHEKVVANNKNQPKETDIFNVEKMMEEAMRNVE